MKNFSLLASILASFFVMTGCAVESQVPDTTTGEQQLDKPNTQYPPELLRERELERQYPDDMLRDPQAQKNQKGFDKYDLLEDPNLAREQGAGKYDLLKEPAHSARGFDKYDLLEEPARQRQALPGVDLPQVDQQPPLDVQPHN